MTNSDIWLLNGCDHNDIHGHRITINGTWEGIRLYASNNTIYGNIITTGDGDGILLLSGRRMAVVYCVSNYNSIWGNIITTNDGTGIEFAGASNNYVYGNSLTAVNGDALYLHHAIMWAAFVDSLNNSLFENNVVATNQYWRASTRVGCSASLARIHQE